MIDAHLLEAIGDAPDHITALRKLAVAFAIGGHLDDDDSVSATELLASLEAVKNTLQKQGRIGKKKSIWTVLPEHLPEVFDDPTKFVPLGEIARIEKGKTGIKQAVPGNYPLVVTAATRESCDHFDFEGAAAIIPLVSSTGHGNASINRLHYQEGQFALGTILAAVFPHDPDSTSARFLFEYLSAYKDELLVSRMTGTANVTLSIGRIAEVPVPLLSSNAQAMVDELMALCDRLEEARKTREEVRDKLTAASLARLTAPDTTAEDFPIHTAFALEALPALTTRPDQIKTLRQTILNLAVRGKLVEQDTADEPAARLAKRIEERKAEILSKTAMRKPRKVADMDPAEIWADLPANWTWTQISDLGFISPRNDADDATEASFVRMPMIFAEYGVANEHEVRPWAEIKKGYTHFAEGDVGLAKITPCFENGKSTVFRNLTGGFGSGTTELHILRPVLVDPDFVVLFLKSPQFIETGIPKMTGTAGQKRVSSEYFTSSPFPLPPLAEQHRIVAKVDALMALCDRLEAALTTADTTRTRLLEALLHEALAPATVTLEAAE